MKIRRLFAVLAATVFLSLAVASEADVIVFRGTGSIVRADAVSRRTVATTLFFVVDFNTLAGNFVFAQKIAGVKSIYDDGARNYGTTVVGPGNTPLVSFTSSDGQFATATNFQFRGIRMRGTRSKVFLRKTDPTPVTIPKTVSGTYDFSAGTPVLIDGNFALTVDVKRTQTANSNNLSVAQTVGSVINEYTSKGYANTLPTP